MRQAIALATSVVTLYGMWLAGSHRWTGWLVGLGNQALWLVCIVVFGVWGLLPLNVALVVVYSRNIVKWRRAERAVAEAEVAWERDRARLWGQTT